MDEGFRLTFIDQVVFSLREFTFHSIENSILASLFPFLIALIPLAVCSFQSAVFSIPFSVLELISPPHEDSSVPSSLHSWTNLITAV